VPNAVVNSVEPDEIGIASGTSATLREVGGVFGVAQIATAFAHPRNYTWRPTFVTTSATRSGSPLRSPRSACSSRWLPAAGPRRSQSLNS
jgi:hypothetical protein